MARFFLVGVFMFACFGMKAQSQFGLNGGVQLTSLHDKEESLNGFEHARIAFRAGGFHEYTIGKGWGIHSEMNYSLAGFKSETRFYNLHYISLPLLVYYSPVKRLKIYLGPEINLLLGTNPKKYEPFGESFNRIDPGLTLGVEFLAFERIGISIRNYFGLRFNTKFDGSGMYRSIDGVDPIIVEDIDLKLNRNNILQLGMNYYFNK